MKKKCSVIIPFICEKYFIKSVLEQINKCQNDAVEAEIIIINQSEGEDRDFVYSLKKDNIKIVNTERFGYGWAIDIGLKYCEGEYVCTLDSDCWPIHKNWLYAPISLIDKHKLSFFGLNSGLELAQPYKEIYAKTPFFCINNNYRISRTDVAQKLSKDVGFLRREFWEQTGFKPCANIEWNVGSDHGLLAQWHSDVEKMGNKFSVCTNKVLGYTKTQGVFGVSLDDLALHLVCGANQTKISPEDKLNNFGSEYVAWMNKIIENNGVDEKILNEMLDSLQDLYCKEYNRFFWDGEKKVNVDPSFEIYKDFEIFKNE